MNRNRLVGISEALEENGKAKARPRAHSVHPQAAQHTPKKNGALELNYQQIEKMAAEGKDLLAMIMGGDSSPPQKKTKTEINLVPGPSPPGRVPSTSAGWQQQPGSRGATPQPGRGQVPVQHGRPGTVPTPHMNGSYPPDMKFAHGVGKMAPNAFSPPPGTSWPGAPPTGLSFKHKQAQFCNPNVAGNNLLAAANAQAQQFRAQHNEGRQHYHQQHNHHEQKSFSRFGHHDHSGPPTPMPATSGAHYNHVHGPPPRPHWQRPQGPIGGHASRLDGRLDYSSGPRKPFHHGRTPNHRSPSRHGGPPRHRSPSRGRQSQPRALVPLFDIDVKPEPAIVHTVDDTPQGCPPDVVQNGEQNATGNHTKSVKPELVSEFDEPQPSNAVGTQQQQAADGGRRDGQPYRIPKKKRTPDEPLGPMLPDVQYFEPDERAASPGPEFYQPDEQSHEQADEQFFEADEPTPSTSSAIPAVVPSRPMTKPRTQRRRRSASREPANGLMKRSQRDAVKEMARNRGRQMKSLAGVARSQRSASQPRAALRSTSRPRTLPETDILTPSPNEGPLFEYRTGSSARNTREEEREPTIATPTFCDADLEEVERENWRPSLIRRMDARKELLKLALNEDDAEDSLQTHVVPPQEESRRARAKLFKRRNVLFEKFLETCARKLDKLEKDGQLPEPRPQASTVAKKTTRGERAKRRAAQPIARKRGGKDVFKKPKLPTPKNRAAKKISKRARATRVDPSDYRAVAAASLKRLKNRLATKAPREAPRDPEEAVVTREAQACGNDNVELVPTVDDPAGPNEECVIKEEVECTEFEAVDDDPTGSEPAFARGEDIQPIFTKEGLCVHCKSHGMEKRPPHTADDCLHLQCHCTQCISEVCLYEEEKALDSVVLPNRYSSILSFADLKN